MGFGKQYVAGQNIEYNGSYYRVKANFISSTSFDDTNLAKMAAVAVNWRQNCYCKKEI